MSLSIENFHDSSIALSEFINTEEDQENAHGSLRNVFSKTFQYVHPIAYRSKEDDKIIFSVCSFEDAQEQLEHWKATAEKIKELGLKHFIIPESASVLRFEKYSVFLLRRPATLNFEHLSNDADEHKKYVEKE